MTALMSYLIVCAILLILRLTMYAATQRVIRDNVILAANSARFHKDGPAPLVSIVIPARNEQSHIAGCIASLLAQEYAHLEIIVVDDRSDDATSAIVRDLNTCDPRVRLHRVDTLPAGWTGKNHALHRGVQDAVGAWLLFVDCDTRQHPANIAVALEYARSQRADLVSLLPTLANQSFWEHVVQPYASILLMALFPSSRVNSNSHPETGFANGQYLLIRRSAYRQIGGHEAVRGELLEDISLARNVKHAGLTLRVAYAPELLSTRMFTTLRQILCGWSRIFYGAVDHRPLKLAGFITSTLLLGVAPYINVLVATIWISVGVDTWAGWTLLVLSGLHYGVIIANFAPLYQLSNSRRIMLLLHVVSCLAIVAILVRAIAHCYTHKIEWRGTLYGPELLQRPLRAGSAQAR
jgi:glycosyltransferase involved in cell wall biosynthesis